MPVFARISTALGEYACVVGGKDERAQARGRPHNQRAVPPTLNQSRVPLWTKFEEDDYDAGAGECAPDPCGACARGGRVIFGNNPCYGSMHIFNPAILYGKNTTRCGIKEWEATDSMKIRSTAVLKVPAIDMDGEAVLAKGLLSA